MQTLDHLAVHLIISVAVLAGLGCRGKKGSMKRSPAPKPVSLAPLTPDLVAGWQAPLKGQMFTRETIFQALNGGAEIYLDYGFQRLLMREYEKPRRPRLTLHLFEMKSAPDAFGIYTQEREGPSAGIGETSDFSGGLLRFWRGRYFVTVLSPRETAESTKAILTLGGAVDKALPRTGGRPSMVTWLPPESQRPRSVRYLHTHGALMHHLRLGSQNVLDLDRRTALVLALYGSKPTAQVALAVRYPTADRAAKAVGSAQRWRPPKPSSPGGSKDPARFLVELCGRVLAGVWGPPAAPEHAALLARLTARIKECQKHGR